MAASTMTILSMVRFLNCTCSPAFCVLVQCINCYFNITVQYVKRVSTYIPRLRRMFFKTGFGREKIKANLAFFFKSKFYELVYSLALSYLKSVLERFQKEEIKTNLLFFKNVSGKDLQTHFLHTNSFYQKISETC